MIASTLLTSILLTTSALARPQPRGTASKTPRALYFITNSNSNEIGALAVDSSGAITSGLKTATGGNGATAFFEKNGTLSEPDSLLSQAPLAMAGNMLFAVNAGSNDVNAFKIDAKDPTKLTAMGKPVKVPGTFPNTITASQRNKLLCVGTSGSKAGVSCAKFDPNSAAAPVKKFDNLRTIDLGQSDPPVGPPNTVSHVLFSDDEDAVRAFVKGDGKKTGTNNGFSQQFDLESSGKISQKGTKTPGVPGALLFGAANLPAKGGKERTLTSDAALGARVLSFDGTGAAKEDAAIDIADQGTPCWTAISDLTGTGFISMVDNNRLVEMDFNKGKISRSFGNNDGNGGFTDLVAQGKFVFALNPGAPAKGGKAAKSASVAAFDVSGKAIKEKGTFDLKAMGLTDGKPAGMVALV